MINFEALKDITKNIETMTKQLEEEAKKHKIKVKGMTKEEVIQEAAKQGVDTEIVSKVNNALADVENLKNQINKEFEEISKKY